MAAQNRGCASNGLINLLLPLLLLLLPPARLRLLPLLQLRVRLYSGNCLLPVSHHCHASLLIHCRPAPRSSAGMATRSPRSRSASESSETSELSVSCQPGATGVAYDVDGKFSYEQVRMKKEYYVASRVRIYEFFVFFRCASISSTGCGSVTVC